MSLEFIARNGIISRGNIIVTGSLTASGSLALTNIGSSVFSGSITQIASTASFGGLVGIGTNTPTAPLHVVFNPSVSAGINIDATSNTTRHISFMRNGVSYGEFGVNASSGEFRWTSNGGAYFPTIYSNGVEAMRIDTSQNVGIGTASPLGRLHIKGSGTTSSTTALLVQNSNASASLSVLDNGFVGVGTAAPVYLLDISGSARISGTTYIGNDGAGSAALFTGGNVLSIAGNNNHDVQMPGLYVSRAGTGYGVGIQATTYATVNSSAILTLTSTTRGFLLPRTNLTSNISSPAQGLMTYVTASATEGLYLYNSGSTPGWQKVITDAVTSSITVASASYALTASYINPLTQSVSISGSLSNIGSFNSSGGNTLLTIGAGTNFQLAGAVGGTLSYTYAEYQGAYYYAGFVGSGTVGMRGTGTGNRVLFGNDDTGTGLVLFGNNTGLGLATPTAKLHVRGTGTTSSTTSLLVQNANASASLAVLDDGYVGVGTSSPSYPFHVKNTSAQIIAAFGNDNTNSRIAIGYGAGGGHLIEVGSWSGYGGIQNSVTNGLLVIQGTSGGNTVIGNTTNPGYKLHVSGSGNFTNNLTVTGSFTVATGSSVEFQVNQTGVKIGNATTDSHSVTGSIAVSASAGSGSALSVYKSGSTVLDVQGSSGQLFSVTDSLTGSLFSVNTVAGLPVMEAFSDNTVNIGKFNTYPIKVVATGSLANITGSFSGSLVGIATTASYVATASYTPTLQQVTTAGNSTTTPVTITGTQILEAGNVHFLTAGYGSSGQFQLRTAAGSVNAIRVTNTGLTGIGTTSPSAKLHVVGSGTTSSTTSFLVQNSAGSTNAQIYDDGQWLIGTANIRVTGEPGNFKFDTAAGNIANIGHYGINFQPLFYNTKLSISTIITISGSVYASGSQNINGDVTITGSLTATSLTASSAVINGNVTVLGTASIAFLNVTYESASVIYSSGSNQLGDALDDTQTLYGNVIIPTGSLIVTGSARITGSLTQIGSSSFSGGSAFSGGTYSFVAAGAGDGGIRIDTTINGYTSFNWLSNTMGLGLMAGGGLFAKVSSGAGFHVGNSPNSTFAAVLTTTGHGTTTGATFIARNSIGTNILKVVDSGLVGINNAAPSASLHVAGNTILSGSAGTGSALQVYKSGSTVMSIQGSQGELFSITDSLSGSLFSVSNISGLPILEVFSDNTTLVGDYLAPALITTKKTTVNSGSTVIYNLPTASYDGGFFDYTIRSGSNARAGQIMAIWSGTSVNHTEIVTSDFGNTNGFTFGSIVSGSNMALTSSASTSGWTLKTIIRSI